MLLNSLISQPFDEYRKLNGFKRALGDNLGQRNATSFLAPLNVEGLPEQVDWRDKGLVIAVKNQVKISFFLLIMG